MSEDSKGEYFNVRCYVTRINPREESPMWCASLPFWLADGVWRAGEAGGVRWGGG